MIILLSFQLDRERNDLLGLAASTFHGKKILSLSLTFRTLSVRANEGILRGPRDQCFKVVLLYEHFYFTTR